MPSAEAWRYIGLELPIRKVGSLCKVSELLTPLELKFLGDRVWLPCSPCQGFAFLLQRMELSVQFHMQYESNLAIEWGRASARSSNMKEGNCLHGR
jgi:hypothetical protein